MRIAKEGWPYVLAALGLGAVASILLWPVVSMFCLAAAGFFLYFFRDPDRKIPGLADIVLAPADGRVQDITPDKTADGTVMRRIGIYLSLWDVHVNRAPIGGKVASIEYTPGRFHPAHAKSAAGQNENNLIGIQNERIALQVRQIAGILARRIVCYVRPGQQTNPGEKIGIIRFGSRVELYLPETVEIRVRPGDRVRAGETVIGTIS